MYCGEILESNFSCLSEKARFDNTTFIRQIRRKYLSYFRFRLSWKKGYISSYRRVLYRCPKCLKSFIKKAILDFHIKSCWADEENLYECEICSAWCFSYQKLVIHKQEHKIMQAHMCPFCGQSYDSLLALKSHEKWHKERQFSTLKKPLGKFTCPHCLQKFTRNSFMEHNEKNQEPLGKSNRCQVCGMHFLYLCQFLQHSMMHIKIETYLRKEIRLKLLKWVARGSSDVHSCKICGICFETVHQVIIHVENHLKHFHHEKRREKNFSFNLSLDNKSWDNAALLQCIDEMKPIVPFAKDSNVIEEDEEIINGNSNIVQKSLSDHKYFKKSSVENKNSVNHTTVCHSENELCVKKLPQSIQNSGISEKSTLDIDCHIRPKSPEIKWPGEAANYLSSSNKTQIAEQLINSLSANSQNISTAQKDSVCKISNSKTVPKNNSKNIAKDRDLLNKNKKESSIIKSDISVNNVSVTCNAKDMNDVSDKCYARFTLADSNKICDRKSASEVICQSRDNSTSHKSGYLKCPACHVQLEKSAFSIHVSEHEKDGWYICHECGLSFWCEGNLEEHYLSNHPQEAEHLKEVVDGARNSKNCITKSIKKNKGMTVPHEKKYYCGVCNSVYVNWKDFFNHVFPGKKGGVRCSKLNTTCMDKNKKYLLKRNCEGCVDKEMISKWRKHFQIHREVKVLVENMMPCKECGEYYGTTEEDHQKHQMIHVKPES